MSSSSSSSYGSWASPITAELIAASAVRLSGLHLDECGEKAYWIEGRAAEGGRSAIAGVDSAGVARDMVPPSVNSRTRVHEYGGGSFYPVGTDGDIITCAFASQGLQLVTGGAGGAVHDLVVNETAAQYRFADFVIDPVARCGKRLLFAVREDHTVDEPSAVVNTIVSFPVLDSAGGPVASMPQNHTILVNAAADPNVMMSSPRLDPSGQYLAWVQWSHPNMPWDDTQLFVAKLSLDGSSFASDPVCVAGGVGESVQEPKWWSSTAGSDKYLFFLSDRSEGWWNIHRARIDPTTSSLISHVECVLRCPGYEFGQSAWQFGYQHFDFLPNADLITMWRDGTGAACLIRLDPTQSFSIDKKNAAADINASNTGGGIHVKPIPRSDVSSLSDIAADRHGNVYLVGGGVSVPTSVLKWESLSTVTGPFARTCCSDIGTFLVIRKSTELSVDAAYMAEPETIEFPTVCNDTDCTAFGLFYAPKNPEYKCAVSDALPPLLVKLHGGPTGRASSICRLDIQFFTSRGIAVLDVDYGGSSGYGREYRNRMQGNWGVVDVEDCCRGASYLASKGLVDSQKLAIQGGSAGGYTALASVAFRNVFHAATSSYGIGDLEALLRETHKFESRYMDGLVGPYPASKSVYESRCPVRYVDNIVCPILFLHGKEDPVCPPNQATDMYSKLVSKGVPTCLILFDGESHGWRKSETICTALGAEINFYGRVFGFTPDKEMELNIVGM